MTVACLFTEPAMPIAAHLRGRFAGIDIAAAGRIDALDLARTRALVLSSPLYDAGVRTALEARAPRLEWVQCLSAGIDKIASAGLPPGVRLSNAGALHAPQVADHALVLMLALARQLPVLLSAQARGAWLAPPDLPALASLAGARCLVLGYGGVGQAICRRVAACGADVVAFNRGGPRPGDADPVLPVSALDAALAEADWLVLALPGGAETDRLIDARRLALLKPGAFLVNVGRGNAVDQAALLAALQAGRLGGAALDVAEAEPLPAGHPLWSLPNVIVTPHVAGVDAMVIERLRTFVADNLARFLAGGEPVNIVWDGGRRL